MAGRAKLVGPESEALRARVVRMLSTGTTVDEVATHAGLSRRTIMRAAERKDDLGAEISEALRAGEAARRRIRAENESIAAAAELAAVSTAPVHVEVIVPEVLQTPKSRALEGDRPLMPVGAVTREDVYDVLGAAFRDPESPLHEFAVQAFTSLHFGPDVDAARASAKAAAKAAADDNKGPRKVLVVRVPVAAPREPSA